MTRSQQEGCKHQVNKVKGSGAQVDSFLSLHRQGTTEQERHGPPGAGLVEVDKMMEGLEHSMKTDGAGAVQLRRDN